MHSFQELFEQFEAVFSQHHFPDSPKTLYEPCSYLLHLGGKRIRPVICLMSHELFADLNKNAFDTAIAIELFHNFTLMHDDIMDQAPLRRGKETVHTKYNLATAILSGDVMNIYSYVHLNKVDNGLIHVVMDLFNQTAIQICEGQQLDMDFELREYVSVEEYLQMISLKTSVLLGASVKLGAQLGGASDGCASLLYEFGKNLGLAFQLKDDYLDSFGDSKETGKQIGGDILSGKKTFLVCKAYELSSDQEKEKLTTLLQSSDPNKIEHVLAIFKNLGIQNLAAKEIEHYSNIAFNLIEEAPVLSKRKKPLIELTQQLLNRKN